MIGRIRASRLVAALAAGLFTCLALPAAQAADKAFQRDELADAAIRLEAQIRSEAGAVNKPVATLKADADAAFRRNDMRAGLQLLGQVAALAPADSANWLRLSQTIFQVRPADSREQTFFMERASTAAYLAYQRAGNGGEEAEALAVLGRALAERKLWRPALDAHRLSLELREVAEVRGRYERLRDDHGFRLLDYSVDSDAASPRVCFQFSEELAKRADFTPFVVLAGADKLALSSEDKQLCVEGLKHGERYNLALRAGLPSTVKETLPKSAEFNVYVRDRKPFARFTSRAYVLPRTGQRGIPVVSVNTSAVAVEIYRIGDRNLINTVLGSDFQTSLSRYDLRELGNERGLKVWSGEMAVAGALNEDVTTAFPVDQAVGELQPGVYVMTAAPKAPHASNGDEDYATQATQWFIVSDLGLTAFSGNDGIHVFVNSLATTAALANAEIRLIARNNEILATRKSDAAGHVLFETGLARGEGGLSPALLAVSGEKGDYAFLSLKASAFDLTDRGVAGRAAPAGLDAFVYAERGVYRSGETAYLTALLRDAQGNAARGAPLTFVVERPDGVEYRRATVADQGAGGYSLALPFNTAVPTGTWRARVFTDPKARAVGETTFMVEDYMPDRIEFELSTTARDIGAAPVEIAVDGRFLYGAPAAGLQIEGEMAVAYAAERPGFAGYQFGVVPEEESNAAERQPLDDLPRTDAAGKATVKVALAKPPSPVRPQEARIFIRMAEEGGRAVERTLTLPVTPPAAMIGVKPLFADKSVGEGDKAEFDVAFVMPDGKAAARAGLRYELLKLEQRYQWYRQGTAWDYEAVKSTRRIADGELATTADKPARLSLMPPPGRYRLDVRTAEADGPLTSFTFDVGWYSDGSADTPDLLETSIDKPEYMPGDTMTVTVNARTAGRLTVNVVGDRLIATQSVDVGKEGSAQVKLQVGRDWGSGAYVVATLRRPLDAQAQRMPGRAIGLKWFGIDRKARTLAVTLSPPSLTRPSSTLKLPVRISGLAPGEEARIAVAAVDVGILNLTGYKPPAPDDHFLGQRRLGAEIRDLYGQLIDGMGGARGQIRSGGDMAAATLQGSPPTQKPLALYSGIVPVGPDGTAEISFDIPDFAGTARVMAVAWSASRVGRATADVTVRDPVVLTATLPRFLLSGDRGTMHLELDNVEGAAGDYAVAVKGSGPVRLDNAATTLKLAGKQRASFAVGLAAEGAGRAGFEVEIRGPDGLILARSYGLDVKPATQILARRTVRALAKGESLTLTPDMFGDLVAGTGGVSVSVSPSSALDAATILKALDRYPFGCSEQIASRALPLLYVNELATEARLALDAAAEQRIRDAIDRLLARQGSNGSFGLWSAGGEDVWLTAYVTDFLTRAREKNFAVPDVAFRQALDHLHNYAVNAEEPDKDGGRELAYALYVLARNGSAPVGDLRYLADTKLAALATPIARAQLAAALALVGDRGRAERVYAAALDSLAPRPVLQFGREDYGSALRDGAALISLAAEGNAPRPILAGAVERVEAARGLTPYTSTQENAWMVLAARALAKDAANIALDVDGEAVKSVLHRSFRAAEVTKPVKITNTGEATLQAVVSVTGAPVTPEPAVANGFKIERSFHALDGTPADPREVKQNERFAVVLKITEAKPEFGRILVVDHLPAGFEIDNPRLVSSGDAGALDWIEDGAEAASTEFRDDRFSAAIERASDDDAVFTVAYVVRAVSPGKYVLPQAYVEDMYNPARHGRTATGAVEVKAAK